MLALIDDMADEREPGAAEVRGVRREFGDLQQMDPAPIRQELQLVQPEPGSAPPAPGVDYAPT
ncbi:hypothetical protein AB0H77_21690 [Streptomyces sp. NPDC050844]|uniref:hypothetical protein n=1 Tax=Streptomyces sp. NPDC050844 TaxID=3155790 RepID=UPI0033D29DE0